MMNSRRYIVMKTVIQIGLGKTCEYLFLADPTLSEDERLGADAGKGLLPDDFDISGKWFYYGLDKSIKNLPFPYVSENHEIYGAFVSDSPEDTTLDNFCHMKDIDHIDLLVMDIEGWEHKVIPTLRDCPPIDYLIVEYHWEKTFKFHIELGEADAKDKFERFMPTDRSKFIADVEKANLHLEYAFPTNSGRTTEMWFRRQEPNLIQREERVPANDPELGYMKHLESEVEGAMGMPTRTEEERFET